MDLCRRCSSELKEGFSFCPLCGTKTEQADRLNILIYASIKLRLMAGLIDIFLCIGMAVSILSVFFFVFVSTATYIFYSSSYFMIFFLVFWLYHALLESSKYGSTIGKRVMNLRVQCVVRKKISFYLASGRFFLKLLSVSLLFLGVVIALRSKKRQMLHDRISDTIVVIQRNL